MVPSQVVTARDLIDAVIGKVSEGTFDFDKLEVRIYDDRNGEYFTVRGVQVAGDRLLLELDLAEELDEEDEEDD